MEDYLHIAIEASKKAGKAVMEIYKGDFDVVQKEDDTPVTKADLLANSIIEEELKETGIPILSEETEDFSNRLESEYVWIVDPIDGTKGFINKDGEFAIQIGMARRGEPYLGVVNVPAKDKLYYAQKGKGAFLKTSEKTQKLDVGHKDNFADSVVFMTKNHYTEDMKNLLDELGVKEVHHVGGIGVKFGLIAEGVSDFDFKLTQFCSEWDLCAPHIILEESGGYVYDLYGNDIHYNTKHVKIANGYVATSLRNKEEILHHLSPFILKRM